MVQFRKKPVVIEAIQWDGTHSTAVAIIAALDPGTDTLARPRLDYLHGEDSMRLFVKTLEGQMEASPGDWIIRGVKGELYPCKPDIFEATYEVASPLTASTADVTPEMIEEGRKWSSYTNSDADLVAIYVAMHAKAPPHEPAVSEEDDRAGEEWFFDMDGKP